jgi:UDP-N-acetylmuramyl tripeptide synthase
MEHLEEKEQNEASHLEDENMQDDENGDEPEKFEKQRYNEIISGKQKQIEHTREIAIESAVKLAKVDADSLVELHTKDPKLAEEVAKRF